MSRIGNGRLSVLAMVTALTGCAVDGDGEGNDEDVELSETEQAVYTTITYYGDRGFVQTLSADRIRACDTKIDGRRVWGQYKLSNGYWYVTNYAPSDGCTYKQHTIPITHFFICVEGLGCGYTYANDYVRSA